MFHKIFEIFVQFFFVDAIVDLFQMDFGAIKKNKMFCVIRNFNLHNS